MSEPRLWLFGLTADEWLHLAAEGEGSEVAPCCGDISELREWLNFLATAQGESEARPYLGMVLDSYRNTLKTHDALADATAFPLLHRVVAGIPEALKEGT